MSDATNKVRDFLTKSPSVVFPDEVLELFIPVEEENAKLFEASEKWMGKAAHLEAENEMLRKIFNAIDPDEISCTLCLVEFECDKANRLSGSHGCLVRLKAHELGFLRPDEV